MNGYLKSRTDSEPLTFFPRLGHVVRQRECDRVDLDLRHAF